MTLLCPLFVLSVFCALQARDVGKPADEHTTKRAKGDKVSDPKKDKVPQYAI